MYHGVIDDFSEFHAWTLLPDSNFEEQLRFLKTHFHVISMDEAASLSEPAFDYRPKAIITFDDGMRNNLSIALPILERYEVPATIYVSTGAIQTGQPFWWDRIIQAVESFKNEKIDLRDFGLGFYFFDSGLLPHLYWNEIQRLLENVKGLRSSKREDVVAKILKRLNCQDKPINPTFAPLKVEELIELASSPLICIGSHTHYHSILTQQMPSDAEESIKKSLVLLRDWIQQPIHHFSFPNGDYNQTVLSIVKKLGMKTAVTTKNGRWTYKTDLLQIPRIGIGSYDNIEVFKANILGPAGLFKRIKASIS